MKMQSTTRKSLGLFWQHTKVYKLWFWIATIGSALGVIFQDIIPPLIVARLFGKLQIAYSSHETLSFSGFMPYLLTYAGFLLLAVAVWRAQGYFVWKFETYVRRDIALRIYNHLQAQSQRFHADRFGGALVSQANKFNNGYEKILDEFIWSITSGLTALLVSLGVLFFVSYKFALVLVSVISLYMLIMALRMQKQFPYNRRSAETDSEQTAALADAITNMSTIRAFANEDLETKRFARATGKTLTTNMTLAKEVLKTDILSHSQTNMFHIIALFFGLIAVTSFHTDVSILYLAIAYTQGIVNRLWQFGRIMRNINQALGDSAEMTDILTIEPEVQDPVTPLEPNMHRGHIEFDHVNFYYPDSNKRLPLFENLSFSIKPGEKVGLVGHSGGGKTTVTRLIMRFMDIQGGHIFIDGQDISAIAQRSLRSQIASVPQESVLFHRTIAENIGYGRPDATTREIKAVAKMAHAHEFIVQLPNQYETLVGERGVKLSGGQRQRISIARAMLKNAPILLLDEATSALDSDSEQLIQDALWKLMEGRTAIVIAHRLSTIQKMDRIIVLEHGEIVEQGTHRELLRINKVYAKLWAHQSGGFIDE